jgi:hypothetical protein
MWNGYHGAHGLELIHRYANGESFNGTQEEAMRAAMYLITMYMRPQRSWEKFQWQGADWFIDELWPQVKDRHEILNGLFGHGVVSP